MADKDTTTPAPPQNDKPKVNPNEIRKFVRLAQLRAGNSIESIRKHQYNDDDLIADVAIYAIQLADVAGIDLREALAAKIEKNALNRLARGVIEAETRTRSIEYARELESQGIHVSQIYADGLIAVTDHLPFVPNNWRVAGALTDVHSSSPNTIHSNEITRTPGVPSGRRAVKIKGGK
jgi:hypothetical protein